MFFWNRKLGRYLSGVTRKVMIGYIFLNIMRKVYVSQLLYHWLVSFFFLAELTFLMVLEYDNTVNIPFRK